MRVAAAQSRAARNNGLTVTELEVLSLVAAGVGSREIAARLFMSRDSVKDHIRVARVTLQAANSAHAVAEAYRQGLLPRVTQDAT